MSPPPDGSHAVTLTRLMRAFIAAGLADGDSEVVQGVGLWLPTGTEDYAIPDLSLVDAGFRDHHIEDSCYDTSCFRSGPRGHVQ